ncbi:synaptogenesis protein syg-2-like [Hyalella azteca]|uniref:Synaptogenesis protein syg-2-like n=1 Tax=Hyalella azteca TaxID=294128 RepID=A0A979FIE9_HYAAZ|nr:synaptogenesis protein syg-2-like [Hyalella azteca]
MPQQHFQRKLTMSGPIHAVLGVKGGRVFLPCDVTPLHTNDRHVLARLYTDHVANLTVIIPPSPPEILLSSGQPVYGVVGPYDEGSQLRLICEATDGEPPPEVVWRLGSHVVDSSWEWPRPGLATNTLTIPELQREHLHASLVCEAHNTNLTIPVTTIVTIEMNLKPAKVAILGAREPLSAGRDYEVACQSSDGRPPALLTWYLDGKLIAGTAQPVSFT